MELHSRRSITKRYLGKHTQQEQGRSFAIERMFVPSPSVLTCRRALKVAHTRSTLRFPARMVWHAGYLQAVEAQELADAIETKHRHLMQQQQQQQGSTVAQKAELDALLAKYEKITGEPYDVLLGQQDCKNATVNDNLHEKK